MPTRKVSLMSRLAPLLIADSSDILREDSVIKEGMFNSGALAFEDSCKGIVELHIRNANETVRVGFAWFNGKYFVTAGHLCLGDVYVAGIGATESFPVKLFANFYLLSNEKIDLAYYEAGNIPAILGVKKLQHATLNYNRLAVVMTTGMTETRALRGQLASIRPYAARMKNPGHDEYTLYASTVSNTVEGDCGLPILQDGKVVAVHIGSDTLNHVNLHLPLYVEHAEDYDKVLQKCITYLEEEGDEHPDITIHKEGQSVDSVSAAGTPSYSLVGYRGADHFLDKDTAADYAEKYKQHRLQMAKIVETLSSWQRNELEAMGYIPGHSVLGKKPEPEANQPKRKVDATILTQKQQPALQSSRAKVKPPSATSTGQLEVIKPKAKKVEVKEPQLPKLTKQAWADADEEPIEPPVKKEGLFQYLLQTGEILVPEEEEQQQEEVSAQPLKEQSSATGAEMATSQPKRTRRKKPSPNPRSGESMSTGGKSEQQVKLLSVPHRMSTSKSSSKTSLASTSGGVKKANSNTPSEAKAE